MVMHQPLFSLSPPNSCCHPIRSTDVSTLQLMTHTSTLSFSLPNTLSSTQVHWHTLQNQNIQEVLCSDYELQSTSMNSSVLAPTHINVSRHYLGNMDILCPYCSALHWLDEKLVKSRKNHPLFGTCCLEGKIRLPLLATPPPTLKALYDGNDDQSKSFRNYTRLYNAVNAFTSLGATFDQRVLTGRGPTSFTIHGELRHRTGSLIPQTGQDGSYAQLYIYDPSSALEVRNRRNPQLRMDVLEIIQNCLLDNCTWHYLDVNLSTV